MYTKAEGVSQAYKKAVKWYRKAAEQGPAKAQHNLAYAYRKGAGIAKDYTEAVAWYRKAAEQGNVSSQFNLVFHYYEGLGVPQDYVQSYMWATIAIAGGHGRASDKRDIVANEMTAGQIAEAGKLAQKWLEQHQ
jgi:TPR repeat protein